MTTPQTLTTANDTWTAEAAANQNYAGMKVLKLDGAGADEKKAYIWFPRPVVDGGRVVSATLKVYLAGTWAAETVVTAKRITTAWGVNRLTWNNTPTVTATNADTSTVAAGATAGTVVEFDISNMLDDVVDGGSWYGVQLTIDTANTVSLHSSEAAPQFRPVIEVVTTLAPDLPDELAPDGTLAVASAKPTFTWEFGALNEESTQSAFKLQVDDDSAFGSVAYDSGWVSSVYPVLDLNHNLLTTKNQSDAETNATGFFAVSSATVARTTTAGQFNEGVAGISTTAHATNANSGLSIGQDANGVTTDRAPVTAGLDYTGSMYIKGSGTHTVALRLKWYDSAGNTISTTTGSSFAVTVNFVSYALTATAPALATGVSLQVVFPSAGATQVIYSDQHQVAQSDGTDNHWRPTATNLVSGTTYYWRVDTLDENGLDSGWSDTAEFRYISPGALAITSPAADNDNVEDNTPTIVHTFGTRTQTQVKYDLYYLVDGVYELVYTRDYTQDTLLSFAIPEGYILVPDGRYKVTISVKDEYPRPEADAVVASRVFDYVPGSTVTAPTAAATSYDTGEPWVTVTWSRASTPDWFIIERDGEEIAQELGADVFVSGTSYAYIDYSAPPNTSVVYRVRAKTDGVGTSQASTASARTTTPSGLWLLYGPEDLYVRLLGQDEVSSKMAEDGQTFKVLNRRDPVRIVNQIGGLEGSVQGILTEDYLGGASSLTTYLSALRTIIGQKGLSPGLRLVFGHRNIPVVVGNFEVREWPHATQQVYQVSFDYWQTGEYEVEVL